MAKLSAVFNGVVLASRFIDWSTRTCQGSNRSAASLSKSSGTPETSP